MTRNLLLSAILSVSAACTGGDPFTTDSGGDGKEDSGRSANERKPELPNPSVISTSKVTMSAALQSLKSTHGPMIEAKFEPDDSGKLSLSLYPVGNGIDTDSERNKFEELAGDPTASPFKPDLSVFTDQEHLTRSARDLTLVQLSQVSLVDAVEEAEEHGKVYWAVPAISYRHAGYNIYLLLDGKPGYGFIDGQGSDRLAIKDLGAGPGAGATDQRTPELGNDVTIVRSSKITMLDALTQVESRYGKTIEAKFEIGDDGKLSLSVYPVIKGGSINAEKATFSELAGDPTAARWTPSQTEFKVPDAEHLTRSARDLTLVQTASISLIDAVKSAQGLVPGGFVYWAIPTIREHRSGYGVYVLGNDNRSHYFFIN